MKLNKLTIEELRERIITGEVVDPLVFLESVMNGVDPRVNHPLVNVILMTKEAPDELSWRVIKELARHQVFGEVSINESLTAGKTLAEYLHPKRKQVELSQTDEGVGGNISSLNEQEIRDFLDVFIEEY